MHRLQHFCHSDFRLHSVQPILCTTKSVKKVANIHRQRDYFPRYPSFPSRSFGSSSNAASLEDIRRQLDSLNRFSLKSARRSAAVLIPLCHNVNTDPSTISILFTLRSDKVSTHKGQVSFPGGMMDPEDANAIECALRETEEEIGFSAKKVQVLGQFHDALSITNVTGNLDLSTLNPSEDELEEIFTLTIPQLEDPSHFEFREETRGRIPVFSAGGHPVWGLTAFILYRFMREILHSPLPDGLHIKNFPTPPLPSDPKLT